MESCERCPLSPSIDWHWSRVSIFLLTKVITKSRLILDMQFPNQPLGIKWKVVKDVHCPPLLIDTGLVSLSFCWQSYYKKYVNFGHAIHKSATRDKMEGCERCPLSPSIDWHWSHVSIFLLTKVITKSRLILDMQFPNQPLGIKWKVVKDVHCPPLLTDTGLMSLSFCWQKLLQKVG